MGNKAEAGLIWADYRIKPARKKDYAKCAEILLEEFNRQDEGFTKKTALKRVAYSPSPRLFFCAEIGKEIIGFIFASKGFYSNGPYYWVNELAVSEEHQHKGVGKALMERLIAEAGKRGVKNVYLNSKEPNIRFYEKLGFEKTGYLGMAREK